MTKPEPTSNDTPADTSSAEDLLPHLAKGIPSESTKLTCPICNAAVGQQDEFFPFCSKRCRLIDFGKWMGGDYKVSRPIDQSDLDEV